MIRHLSCWCGNKYLVSFSSSYDLCPVCHTLIFTGDVNDSISIIKDDVQDFYGKGYWFDYLEGKGQPNILSRARSDLIDRDIYWLKAILKYKLPPARVLEIGSSHGGFVALLRMAGYDATGLELSPWIVNFSEEVFGVSTLLGPIENQKIEPGSLDLIILMDVLEHFADPKNTIRLCLKLLKPDGLLIIQTPCFPESYTYDELCEREDPFLKQLKPYEHLYLFSSNSVSQFFSGLGAEFIQFEPSLFKQYDMFFVVGLSSLVSIPWQKAEEHLESTPTGRFSLALLDLYQANGDINDRFLQADRDRESRQEIIQRQSKQLEEIEKSRDSLNKQLQLIQSHLIYRGLRKITKTLQIDSKYFPKQNPEKRKYLEGDLNNEVKRIAIDLTPVRPGGENGGAKWMALELIRQLSRVVAPQWEYILLTADDSHEELSTLDAENVKRVCLVHRNPQPIPKSNPPRWHRMIHFVAKTLETCLPKKVYVRIYDIYHNLRPAGQTTSILKKLNIDLLFCPFTAPFYYDPHIPVIITVHDLQWAHYPQFFTTEDNIHTRNYFNRSCQVATRLVCISEFTRNSVLEMGKVELDRVITIPNCLFSTRKKLNPVDTNQVLERFSLRTSKYLYYPANFWPHKNHAMLLVAFNMYLKDRPDESIKLVFSGAPRIEMDRLQQAVQKMGLEKQVLFLGFVTDEEFTALLQSCLGLIFPSFFEGFGIPILEAMSFGKPVLCSNATSLPEVGGDAVLYFDPRRPDEIKDALEEFIEDSTLRGNLSSKGLSQAKKFLRVEEWANRYYQVFSEVLVNKYPHKYALSGIFEDGWIGEKVSIYFLEDNSPRQIELDLEVMPWLPRLFLNIDVEENESGTVLLKHKIQRGEKELLQIPLPPTKGSRDFLFYPFIQPQLLHIGLDSRYLSCLCHSCRIISSTETITLYDDHSKK